MISIVVLNHNGTRHLKSCFDSIKEQTNSDYETILVDNGSTDNSSDYVREKYPWVNILSLPVNQGFSRGVNTGIKKTKGEAVFLLNNDTVLDRECLDSIKRALKEHPQYLFFAPKMLSINQKGIIDSGGIIFRDYKCYDRGQGQRDDILFSKEEEVFGGCGGAVVFRKEFFEKVGYFDDDFFAYYEDVDLAFQAQLKGEKCLFIPRSRVYHSRGATNVLYSDYYVFHSGKNGLNCIMKNLPTRLFLRNLKQLLLNQIREISYFTKRGQGWPILKSKIASFLSFPKILKSRWEVQNSIRVSSYDLDVLLRGNGFYGKTG